MRVTVLWQGGMKLVGTGEFGREVIMDAAPDHGGQNEGTRPSEVFLMGMAGCTALDVLSILTKKRLTLKSFCIEVEAEQAAEHPRVFTAATLIYRFTGDNLLEEQVKHAIELSLSKYCGMVNTVKNSSTHILLL
jgi:putative redox protein